MHGVLKAPLFAFTLACVAGLSFDAFFIKENRWGKLWGFDFSIHFARFLVCPRLRVSRTHTGQKNNQKTASYPGYLYTNGGTSPHRHLVPIRLLWLVPAKKAVLFVMPESSIALLCSHIAVTNRHISWLFHQVWKRPLKPTEKGNCEANKKCLSNVVSFAPKMASSCFKILSWRYLKIPAIKFDPYLLNTATQPLNTPTSLWPRCVSVCLWRTDFLSLSLTLDFLF